MAKRRPSTHLDAIGGINMTPLMDLTFLLLIVFMITAPMLEYTIDVTPPKMNADKIDHENNLLVSLDAEGQILYRGDRLSTADLIEQLRQVQVLRPEVSVLIRGHEARPYGEIIGLMKAVRNAGLYNVSLVTQAE